jgi:putative ABC transport system permease protein
MSGNRAEAEVAVGTADPVGKTIRLSGSPFLVIGVLVKKPQDSSYSGRDKDNVLIPGTTFRTLTGAKFVDEFIFKAAKSSDTGRLKSQVLEIAAGKHRFDPKDKEAIAIWDTTENFKFIDTFMLGFRAFLAIVGSLTLVVGGIGVSNIMNVVVEERTREIGIKMALGARPGSIRSTSGRTRSTAARRRGTTSFISGKRRRRRGPSGCRSRRRVRACRPRKG